MKGMGYEVVVEERGLVKPAAGSKHGRYLYLSSLDLYWREAPYSRRVLFYEKQGKLQQEEMVSKLRSSLAQLLLPFYPAAGRLVTGPSRRPSILCDGQGVEFLVARVNAPLSSCLSSSPCSFFDLLAPYHHSTTDNALLAFQITKFVCGGLAIGFSYSHVLVDGHSMWHFMNSWAECARNEAISIPPYHNREVFKVDSPSNEEASQFTLPICKTSSPEEVASPSLAQNLLHFSPGMIYKMKLHANDNRSSCIETIFSDYDVLCAHMWKSVIASQAHSRLDNEVTMIGVQGDMRFRMKPQLPRGYFGNGAIFAFASSLVTEIRSEALGAIAQKIHEACKACNESRLWAMVNWLELHDNVFDKKSLPWMVTCLNVVSSPKFKVYDVDFGWGTPIAIRTTPIHNTRDMVLFPGYNDGIDICVLLPNP